MACSHISSSGLSKLLMFSGYFISAATTSSCPAHACCLFCVWCWHLALLECKYFSRSYFATCRNMINSRVSVFDSYLKRFPPWCPVCLILVVWPLTAAPALFFLATTAAALQQLAASVSHRKSDISQWRCHAEIARSFPPVMQVRTLVCVRGGGAEDMDVDGGPRHLADLHSNVIRRAPRGLIIKFVRPFSWSTQAASLFWKPPQEHKQETACRPYALVWRRPERRWEFQKCPSKLLHLGTLSSAAAAAGQRNKVSPPPARCCRR